MRVKVVFFKTNIGNEGTRKIKKAEWILYNNCKKEEIRSGEM